VRQTMKKVLRFGCIGCGGMGTLHVRNSKFIPGFQVAAYADVEEAKAKKFLNDFGGEYATDRAEKIIEDRTLDGILLQIGPQWHPKLGIAAAQAGKHIFVEKPIAATLKEADEFIHAVRKNKVKALVGFCNRLAPMVRRAKQLCPNPHYSFCMCAGSIVSQACHNLDLAVHLFHEAKLLTVYASGGRFYNLDPGLPVDSFSAVLRFADGSTHTYLQHGNAANAVLRKYHFQLFDDAACVYLAKRFKEVHYCTGPDTVAHSQIFEGPDFNPGTAPTMEDCRGPFGYMGHYEELVALAEAIRSDTEPPLTLEQGREVLRVEKAILESAATGKVIDMAGWRL
jgi:predicted dehydrogenase